MRVAAGALTTESDRHWGPVLVANYGRPYGHVYRSALESLVSGLAAILRSDAAEPAREDRL